MKWIILLAFVACGKHEQPSAVDLKDSDGDQVLNYQEGEAEKYIADFETLGNVSGRIKFVTDIQGEIPFSNQSYLLQDPLKIMIGDVEKKDLQNYFTEWSDLRLDSNKGLKTPNQNNTLHLYFDHVDSEPTELILSKGDTKKSLGVWVNYMRVNLTKEEFERLMTHDFHFSLRKNFRSTSLFDSTADQTIQSKTNKVYFSENGQTQVLYVAKELLLEKLLHYLEIKSATVVTNSSLFFNSQDQSGKEWFIRKFPNGDMAIVKTNLQDLKTKFFERYITRGQQLKRENGISVKSLKVKNDLGDRVYFKIRPSQNIRTFNESQKDIRYRVGSPAHGTDDSWICTHFNREVKLLTKIVPTIDDLIKNLTEKESFTEMTYLEQFDEKGVFWEIMVTANRANLNLSLLNMPQSSFTTIGEYLVSCERGRVSRGGSAANVEEHLTFDIETFVEKTQ